MSPRKGPFQKDIHLPTIDFHGTFVSFWGFLIVYPLSSPEEKCGPKSPHHWPGYGKGGDRSMRFSFDLNGNEFCRIDLGTLPNMALAISKHGSKICENV